MFLRLGEGDMMEMCDVAFFNISEEIFPNRNFQYVVCNDGHHDKVPKS